MPTSTALYPNRQADMRDVVNKLEIPEFPTNGVIYRFYINHTLISNRYNRIVYGDHGPYVEFNPIDMVLELTGKFYRQPPSVLTPLPPVATSKYYYYWMYTPVLPHIKFYLQIKDVKNLPNAPRRDDGKRSAYNRPEGYADYKRGMVYVHALDFDSVTKEMI